MATNVGLVVICAGGDGTAAGCVDATGVDFTVGAAVPDDGMWGDETVTAVEVVAEVVESLSAPLRYSVSSQVRGIRSRLSNLQQSNQVQALSLSAPSRKGTGAKDLPSQGM